MNTIIAGLSDHIPAAQYLALLASGELGKGATARARATLRKAPEEDLHRACFEWVELVQPQHTILRWLFHCPSGGKRPRGEAGKLKGMGTKPGVPDFLLPRRHRQWAGLAIELKSDTGRLSLDQKAWLDAFEQEGYLTAVCRTLDEFTVAVMRYLKEDPPARPRPSDEAT
ncbi:hypothetical protein Rfer_4465 (plasmid) [Rhodoferax ferrireducens T118]|uniref:VRR-NUC domain-containing protein n=1 Tax=Albidiferax ferrireducens (strain ATCC BAA-621 / DSM 15236 / T118) TaxID=338969 RepID=Q21PZ4_ALBFT|nr:VRR-NUC domain-containing protein [Rhodoferax ferrireducens]ABD72151.1 hypothetical protein Rfer_4465 [Rhodoferax ferrireducens T118]